MRKRSCTSKKLELTKVCRSLSAVPAQCKLSPRKMNIPVLLLGLVFTSTSAQNIYEGCGSEKECLGFVKGMDDTQTTCMETEVVYHIIKHRPNPQDGPFSYCWTADFVPHLPVNQLNNNQKITKLRDLAHPWILWKMNLKFQDCTLVVAFSNSTTEGYATFEVMHVDAGEKHNMMSVNSHLFPYPMSNLNGPFMILILAASSYFLAPLAGQRGQNTAWRERVPERVTACMKRHRIS